MVVNFFVLLLWYQLGEAICFIERRLDSIHRVAECSVRFWKWCWLCPLSWINLVVNVLWRHCLACFSCVFATDPILTLFILVWFVATAATETRPEFYLYWTSLSSTSIAWVSWERVKAEGGNAPTHNVGWSSHSCEPITLLELNARANVHPFPSFVTRGVGVYRGVTCCVKGEWI